jgi:hypothetical protein
MSRPKPPIERTGQQFRINLDIEERDLIKRLMNELRQLLSSPVDATNRPADDRLRRLFPAAYHQSTDREMDEEYARLMYDELQASWLRGLDVVDGFISDTSKSARKLSEEQVLAFVQALNGIRLVLGTILDVSEDHDFGDVPDSDPLVGEYQLYDFLSWVLDWSVRALQS